MIVHRDLHRSAGVAGLLWIAMLTGCHGPDARTDEPSASGSASSDEAGPANGPANGEVSTDPTAPRVVSFPTQDGGVVFAHEFSTGDHGLVLAHGGRFTKESWTEQIPDFVAEGFRVVAIDFRGRGESRGPDHATAGDDVRYDVLAAVHHLRATGCTTVSVVGGSFGGWAAAEAMIESPGVIDRIVLMASPSVDHPEQLRGRKLFLTTREDFYGEGRLRLPYIQDQFDRAPEPKDLVILDGDAHAQFIFDTEQGPVAMEEILRFLSEP